MVRNIYFNVLKPLSDKLSKAIFDKLHENMQVNMSSYKKKKMEAQRTDKRTLYVSGKAEVKTISHFQNLPLSEKEGWEEEQDLR